MSVFKALLEAQKNAEGLKKDGKNGFAKFDYVSAENVVKTARELLHQAGLLFFPSAQMLIVEEGVSKIAQDYTLIHPESETRITLTRTAVFEGEKGKNLSQAQGSAETYMLKNILRELLLIPRFDANEDIDSRDHTSMPQRTVGNPAKYRRA